MAIFFLHPQLNSLPSGGNAYNRHILAQAAARSFPLVSVPVAPSGLVAALNRLPQRSAVIWDSLFLAQMADRTPLDRPNHGLLLHFIPHQNPLLSKVHSDLLKSQFNRAISRARFVLVTGAKVKQYVNEQYPRKTVYLIEPGVSPEFQIPRKNPSSRSSGNPIALLTVANVLPAKGHRIILNALSQISGQNWIWHWVGSERPGLTYADCLLREAERLGLSDRIRRHGVMGPGALADLMSTMDVFASASLFESYGMALAEAVAAGLPAVTTDVGEAARIVRHQKTGLISPVGEQEQYLGLLRQLLTDKDLRHHFRNRLLKQHPRTWETAFDEFADAIDDCL